MNDSPLQPTDPLGKLPRYVKFRGRLARVLGYEDGKFEILDYNDMRYRVTRDRITFVKGKTKA